MNFNIGSLVRVRERNWITLPSISEDLLYLKPLDGSEAESLGIYLPLDFDDDIPESASFPPPTEQDLGDFDTARLLFNAARLSVRNASGPFRSMGKLSFRPRAYQMVPLIMALRQEPPIRLLIADDVGVGKTIEALLILKELLERGEISRFAVISPPHLCEQWQAELRDKFGTDAVIIRSNTQARLDRDIPGDTPVFRYYPFQVISIDYLKAHERKQKFVQDGPDFIIVDEAHTCSRHGKSKKTQQLRHDLLKALSERDQQHLLLLTATPHSGKPEQFNSLLSLLKPEYLSLDLKDADRKKREDVARHFVQRRRGDVEKWLGEETPFPKREAREIDYELSHKYADYYKKIWRFTLGHSNPDETGKPTPARARQRHSRYWSALTLLRGVMSSPQAGVAMLKNRMNRSVEENTAQPDEHNDKPTLFMEEEFGAQDYTPAGLFDESQWSQSELQQLETLANDLDALSGVTFDLKIDSAVTIIKKWLKDGFNPVVFCKFIATANYVGQVLKAELAGSVDVRTVTSEDPDDVRRERIADMIPFKRKVLVATDCMSEGINLQEQFTAVLHYDLPWNPNRLEQRDGRVDRYGQQSQTVKTYLLKSKSNPIDEAVYNVLLRKVREIHRSIGVSVPFSGESIMDAVLEAVLARPEPEIEPTQAQFDFGPDSPFQKKAMQVTRQIDAAAGREKRSRSIFAQHTIKAEEIEKDLSETDMAIGNPEAVEQFVTQALRFMGAQIDPLNKINGYQLFTANLPEVLKQLALNLDTPTKSKEQINISFVSPTPEGCIYIGRNHAFVEQLCRLILADALNPASRFRSARASVIRTPAVKEKTTLLLLRVRNVLKGTRTGRELVAEEMLAFGFHGFPDDRDFPNPHQVQDMMNHIQAAHSTQPMSRQSQARFLLDEIQDYQSVPFIWEEVAQQRAQALIDAHERFYKVVRGTRFKILQPVLPMDLMGIYILLPEKNADDDPEKINLDGAYSK